MTIAVETDLDREVRSPFVPLSIEPRYKAPRASVDPDQSKKWVRRMLPVVLAHGWMFGLALGCAFIALVVQVAIPRIVMQAVDKALVDQTSPLAFYIWLLVILGISRGVFTYIQRYYLLATAYMIEYDLRAIIYSHIVRLSFSFFDRVQSGQIISRSNSDIRSVQQFLVFGPMMLISMLSFFFAFGLMLTIDAPLAIVALAPMPLVFIIGYRMRKLMFPVSWIVMARTADLTTVVEENISGVRVVKAFAAEKSQIRLLARAAQRLRWAALRQIRIRALYGPAMENIPRLTMALILLYGGYLAIEGQVTIGAIIAFSSYVVMLMAPFRLLGMLMMLSQRSAASAERIFEILDEQPEIKDRDGAEDLVHPKGGIEFRDVSFAYANGTDVLTDLSLKINPGEIVAMVGRTGSGKSTLARMLARFYDVSKGAVLVDGTDVRGLTVASVRAHVGYVLDEPILFSISVRENIAYGKPDAPFEEIVAAAKAAGADSFIRELSHGYDTVVGERGYTLSGGQRQRISIARTLLVNPRILILDDATSSIDAKIEQEIHEALKTLMLNRTTLIIAHRLSTISLAQRVVLLEKGRIMADGTHAELMRTEPRYVEILARAEEEAKIKQETKEKAAAKEMKPIADDVKAVEKVLAEVKPDVW
jgi:ATP-binding cassette subfamily B protein